ncbi:MAG TPA: hypothetical protein P5550_11785, partial [Bacteroidales bacterium]|nr:hypothetical protein [Bacteroidales bacterium]
IFTLAIAAYQRTTGPTYPVRGKTELGSDVIRYRLIRTHVTGQDARVSIEVPAGVNGEFTYRRFKSFDSWHTVPMLMEGSELAAYIPQQPAAGKVEYKVTLSDGSDRIELTAEPVVLRYKGHVPDYVLIPHIILMFLAMLFSTRAGIEGLIRGKHAFNYTAATLFLLLPGGMILGPIVQKFAFDAYWTGWPVGTDLTDNKTAVAFIAWIIAFVRLRKDRTHTTWAWVAALILLAVYLIPHSMMGSEIDHTQVQGAIPAE